MQQLRSVWGLAGQEQPQGQTVCVGQTHSNVLALPCVGPADPPHSALPQGLHRGSGALPGAQSCFMPCRKNMQRNKQVAMGRKKFNMDPKKVLWDGEQGCLWG